MRYIFLDESGELGFKDSSSKYFVITLLSCDEGEIYTLRRIIKKVEDLVNAQIQKSCEVMREEMPLEIAKQKGATGIFDAKYGEIVSVYTIKNCSKEICTGPHVKNTCELGKFKILKEESSSAGVRRIKAILN